MQLMTISKQATMVDTRAPTAIHQKSFGVPSQVRGISRAETITIQTQRERWRSADSARDPTSWEMRTMKTQPPPYRVRLIDTIETILPQDPTAFWPMAG